MKFFRNTSCQETFCSSCSRSHTRASRTFLLHYLNMLHVAESMQNWILPFTTNWNNVLKFFLINTVIIPLLKLGLYAVVCRLATLRVLNGGKVRVRETRSALYGLSSHYFGGQKWRFLTIMKSCGFLAISLICEYGFGTAQVDRVKRIQILEPTPFRILKTKDILCMKRRPSNWFLKQSSCCMDRLEASTYKDSAMERFRGHSRTELKDHCVEWALTMRNPARKRFAAACAQAGKTSGATMSYMVLNWTNNVKFREGAVSYPNNHVVCVGHTRKNVESRGHVFGVGWDHNALDRIFMLPVRKKNICPPSRST